MTEKNLLRLVAAAQILVGVLAIPMIHVLGRYAGAGLFDSEALIPFAMILAVSSVAAGVSLFYRPIAGAAFSILLLAPQSVSFALGSTTFALSLWPWLGLELNVPEITDISTFAQIQLLEPTLWLRREATANYIGFGIGFNLVTMMVLAILLWASSRLRNAARTAA